VLFVTWSAGVDRCAASIDVHAASVSWPAGQRLCRWPRANFTVNDTPGPLSLLTVVEATRCRTSNSSREEAQIVPDKQQLAAADMSYDDELFHNG
jgi:hypothetical protein